MDILKRVRPALVGAGAVALTWAWRVAIAVDQLGNALLGGDPDETISSRAGKAAQRGHWISCVLCRLLNIFEADHCAKSIERDEGRRLPATSRTPFGPPGLPPP